MRNVWILALALCAVVATASAEKLKVSSFSSVLTEIAQEVGGEKVAVTGHVKPGVDPHDFEPRPADLKAVASSDLVLLSALQMEGYVGRLREAAGGRANILQVGDRLPALRLAPGAAVHAHGNADPHWWHTVGNIARATRMVRDEFGRLRPDDKAAFAANASAYLAKLDRLQSWVKAKVAELPRDRRKLVTSHDAFGYFAKEFGFSVYPIAGISRGDQPGSRKVAEIIATIRT
ncbi:MAG: zinc ABC transporter substrate-binding protein, partial [Chthoniobacteraceae bacterium]